MSSCLPPSSLCPVGVDSSPACPRVDLIPSRLPSPVSRGGSGSASLGLRFPLRLRHLPVLAGGSQRGALHEEDLLQAAAPLLHSSGDWNSLLQRPLPAHSRGRERIGGSLWAFLSLSLGLFLSLGARWLEKGKAASEGSPERGMEGWKVLGAGVWKGIAPGTSSVCFKQRIVV